MKRYSIVIFIIAALSACTDLDIPPIDRETSATFWDTQEDAINALNTCYPDLFSADRLAYMESLSDNSYTKSGSGWQSVNAVANGNYDADNDWIKGVWRERYAGIRRCNIFLENIEGVSVLSDGVKDIYSAEARFIRAFHYIILTQHYGDVPLVQNVISISASKEIGRSPLSEVQMFIKKELSDVIDLLPYPKNVSDVGRISKGAAVALKARYHLYLSEWDLAAQEAEKLINSSEYAYGLVANYASVFDMANENNEEIILDVQFMPVDREHGIQKSFIPPSQGGYASISPLQDLVDSYLSINGKKITDDSNVDYDSDNPYVKRDPRMQATIIFDGHSWVSQDGSSVTINTAPSSGNDAVGGTSNATETGYYVAKFYDQSARNLVNSGLNLPLIRYAEVLLIYAEAMVEQDKFDASQWDMTIKALRLRAGFVASEALDFPGGDKTILRDIIRNERRVELAMEGLRYYDLVRWGLAQDVLHGKVYGMKASGAGLITHPLTGYIEVEMRNFDASKHYLWPIPQDQADLNPNLLPQNPNW